jgi:hypothetical protein
MRTPALLAALWLSGSLPLGAVAQEGPGHDEPLDADVEDERRAFRRPRDAGDLPADYRWEDAAKDVLTPDQIKRLAADKLVILSKTTYPQVGAGYYWSDIPPFITSDSLLATYHRLYEDSIIAMEQRRAARLRPVLQTLWAYLPDGTTYFGEGEDPNTEAGRRRAQFVIGVAMRLLGDEPLVPQVEDGVARQIDAEVERILQTADERAKAAAAAPEWPKGVDYDRLRPRGFYTRTEQLQRYFRAVAWLQEVRFFVDDEVSLAAFVMLVRGVPDPWDGEGDDEAKAEEEEKRPAPPAGHPPAATGKSFWAFHGEFAQFVGGRDDWDLLTFRSIAFAENADAPAKGLLDADGLADARKRLETWWKKGLPYRPGLVGERENDDRAYFCVMSALRTPDAVMFTETADLARFKRSFPNGLEVPGAMGSEEALALLRAGDGEPIVDLIRGRLAVPDRADQDNAEEDEDLAKHGGGRTLYADYLHCLGSLVDAPEPDAPPLFSSTPWKRKSLQTVCGGWAQLRHTWTLQAKESGGLFGGNAPLAGIVEPEPEFFARLADLAARTERVLARKQALSGEPALRAAAARGAADLIERLDFGTRGAAALRSLSATDAEQLKEVLHYARRWSPEGRRLREDYEEETDDEVVARALPRFVPQLRAVADRIEKGEEMAFGFDGLFRSSGTPVGERWRLLERLTRGLESLAHKQLRGARFSAADKRFLRNYSERLSEVMGYPSADTMPDDAPWVASVFHRDGMGNLQVATGRPTAMYVLYPHEGRDVLCLGVVVPYHEFVRGERLTDEAWRALLDSPERPAVAGWVGGLYSDEAPPEE